MDAVATFVIVKKMGQMFKIIISFKQKVPTKQNNNVAH